MSLYLTKYASIKNLINLIFSLIPFSFIAGNMILNINIILFLLVSIFFYGSEIIKLKFHFLDKIILFYFLFILFTGIINNLINYNIDNSSKDFEIIIKTIGYLRYLILYFVIRYLINKNFINFKIFFISSAIASLFVSLDLIYQYIFGVDIFGYQGNIEGLRDTGPRRLAGPFGDEYIAGSFLQRFAIFSFFLIPLFFKINNKKVVIFITFLLFLLTIFSLVIAGNRMPIIIFIFTISLLFVLERNIRKHFFYFLVLTITIFFITYNVNSNVKKNYHNAYTKLSQFYSFFSSIKSNNQTVVKDHPYAITINGNTAYMTNTYIKEFYSGYRTWLQNKYIGGGIKSYKLNCKRSGFINCAPHPHNYYIEILASIGLIGFFITSIIFSITIYNAFVKKYSTKISFKHNLIITPFIFLLFAEVFPIKSTGSFFTTGNATFVFLMLSITISLSRLKNLN